MVIDINSLHKLKTLVWGPFHLFLYFFFVLSSSQSLVNACAINKKKNCNCSSTLSALLKHRNNIQNADTTILVDGKTHLLTYSMDSLKLTISLADSAGKVVFNSKLTKDVFSNTIDQSVLKWGFTLYPVFHGYLHNFNSFLFTVDFWIPDTDIGEQCFLMLNRNGELIESHLNKYYGGGGCDGEIQIPGSHSFVLTCSKIIYPNGQHVKLSEHTKPLVGIRLINDSMILLIHQYDQYSNPLNARIVNGQGRVISSFTYNGYYQVLEYTIPIHFDTSSFNYILLDETQQNIRVINKLDPAHNYAVPFESMMPVDNNFPNEHVFNLNTEASSHTFSFDQKSKRFKHQKNK